jgi:hypothetical protein
MKTLTIIKYVFALIGAGMLIGAGFGLANTRSFLAHASRAEGTVIALQPRYPNNTSSSNSTLNSSSTSITFAPMVRFSHDGQVIDFTASTASNPPSYHIGETVPVLYLPSAPFKAKIDSFFSLWGGPLIVGGLGAIFLLIGGLMILLPRLRAQEDDRLMHEGMSVDADLQSVDLNTGVTVNGRSPFRITAQWQDPSTSRMYVFVSRNIWFDPSKYITGQNIKVFIARGNPKRYYVDLSFLPTLAN